MKKKKEFLVVANWKSNPESLKLAKNLFNQIKKAVSKLKKIKVVVCPSFLHLIPLSSSLGKVLIGSQDVFYEPSGQFTGMIGYEMLFSTKVKYSILGHSEKRALGETDEEIAKKILVCLDNGIIPVVCIGEPERNESLDYLDFIKNQLIKSLKNIPKSKIPGIVIAYEPIWAIGKNAIRQTTSKEIEEVVIFIKRVVSDIYETRSVPPIKIIYGGGVDEKQAQDFMQNSLIDGFLVGRASLDGKKFAELLKTVDSF